MKKLLLSLIFGACLLGGYAQFDQGISSTAWSTTGNANTTTSNFIGTTDLTDLIFKTGDTERMRLSSNWSYLGIGTSNPQASLHLHYAPYPIFFIPPEPFPIKLLQLTTPITGNGTKNGFSIYYYYGFKDIILKQYEQANFYIEGPEGGLMIAPNGNMGMGTDIPRQKLHVEDGNILINRTSAKEPGVPKGSIIFDAPSSDNPFYNGWGIERVSSRQEGFGLNFWKYAEETPESVLFLSDYWQVGIGTKNPQAELDVSGSFKARSATITGNTYLNGDVGIGTTKPKQKLHIVDGNLLISKTSAKDIDAPQSPNGSILFGGNIDNSNPMGKWGIEYLNGEDDVYGLNFWRPWNPDGGGYFNYGLFLADNGNIGINKKDPNARLDVNGAFKAIKANITDTITTKVLSAQSAITTTLSTNKLNVPSINLDTVTTKILNAESATIATLSTNKLNVPSINYDTISTKVLKTQNATVIGNSNLNGNVVIGTTTQPAQLNVNGAFSAKNLVINTPLSVPSNESISIFVEQPIVGSTVLSITNDGIGQTVFKVDGFGMVNSKGANITGNVTVKEGAFNLALGDAAGAGSTLGYGTSYIGFNAVRNNGYWTFAGNNTSNGGAVIWGTIGGGILISAIPSSGGTPKTLTDAQIRDNAKLYLSPAGILNAREIIVATSTWSDFVFSKDYKLPTLNEIEQFIAKNQHLPNVPSAAEVEANGIQLGEMNAILIQKVEELTLYIIQLEKRLSEVENKKGGE